MNSMVEMNPNQVEAACRRLCELNGVDLDAPCDSLGNSYWRGVRGDIIWAHKLQHAISYGLSLPPDDPNPPHCGEEGG